MFREKMQIQLLGSVDGGGSESKKLQVNSALKEAFQRNFSKGNMFPFVDEGFSAINQKKFSKHRVHDEEAHDPQEQERQEPVVIQIEKKSGDVFMKNE